MAYFLQIFFLGQNNMTKIYYILFRVIGHNPFCVWYMWNGGNRDGTLPLGLNPVYHYFLGKWLTSKGL